jgi:hypothetical protein
MQDGVVSTGKGVLPAVAKRGCLALGVVKEVRINGFYDELLASKNAI